MSFSDIIKNSVLEGFVGLGVKEVVIALFFTCILSVYIFVVYYFSNRKSFYDKTYNMSIALVAIITAGIVLAMQSNFVISLGMVGALSIVRFRTAIKNPLDLVFMFWAISVGIVNGAGLYIIAILISLIITIGLWVLELTPMGMSSMLLIVNMSDIDREDDIIKLSKKYCKYAKVKSRNVSKSGCDIIIECKVKKEDELLKEIFKLSNIISASLIAHDGDVAF